MLGGDGAVEAAIGRGLHVGERHADRPCSCEARENSSTPRSSSPPGTSPALAAMYTEVPVPGTCESKMTTATSGRTAMLRE